MQLMIDVHTESAESLRLTAIFLNKHADLIEAMNGLATAPANESLTIPPPAPTAPPAPVVSVAPVAPVVPPVSNVINFVPPAPVVPPAPIPTGPLEYDSAGVPWDARIHQKAKSKKKDLTWKLQKGLDPVVVSQVMQELQSSGKINTPAPVGASAPVLLPPTQRTAGYSDEGQATQGQNQTQVPPPPQAYQENQATQGQNQTQVPPPPSFQAYQENQAAPPIPPPPGYPAPPPVQETVTLSPGSVPPMPLPAPNALGVSDTSQPGMVSQVTDFRSLVTKITQLRSAGRLTADQVNNAVAQSGAPNLQTLAGMAHLVPTVDAFIDAILASQ